MTVKQDSTVSLRLWLWPVVIGIVASLPYIYEYLLRVMPAAMTKGLLVSFDIQAVGLGTLGAAYFWGYAAMQVPVGMLLDKYGARRLLAIGMLLAALATWLFGFTTHFSVAVLSRVMVGAVVAFGYLGALRIGSRWFPDKRFALYAGLVQLLGCVGAILGGAPVAAISDHVHWRVAAYLIAGLGVILAVIIYVVLRDQPSKQQQLSLGLRQITEHDQLALGLVFKNPQTWWVALYGFAIWAPITIFPSLWGVPFLETLYQINAVKATSMIASVWVGVAFGGPLLGWLSNHIHNRRLPMIVSAIVALLTSLMIILAAPWLSKGMMIILLFLFGMAGSAQALCFGLVLDLQRREAIATASGFTNMAVILGGVILQPAVGFVLNHLWDGSLLHGVPAYSVHAYQMGLLMMPLCSVLAWVTVQFFIKPTYAKSLHH